MKALVLSELERIWGKKRTVILFILNLVLVFGICMFINISKIGFYDRVASAELNSLNFAPFVLREGHLILAVVICPIIFIDCLNHEKTSGEFRLCMLRAYSKVEYIVSKWMALSITLLIFVLSVYIISTVFGLIVLPQVEFTEIINVQGKYGLLASLIYNLKFYIIEYIVLLCVLGIASMVSIVVPNAVLAVITTIGALIGSLYIWDGFSFLLLSTDKIFDVLGGLDLSQFLISSIGIIIVTSALSGIVWSKKGYYF